MAEPITPHPPTGDFDKLVRKMILDFEGSKINVSQIIEKRKRKKGTLVNVKGTIEKSEPSL